MRASRALFVALLFVPAAAATYWNYTFVGADQDGAYTVSCAGDGTSIVLIEGSETLLPLSSLPDPTTDCDPSSRLPLP